MAIVIPVEPAADIIEKFESEVPSVLIFVWDFEGKIFDETFREFMELYNKNR